MPTLRLMSPGRGYLFLQKVSNIDMTGQTLQPNRPYP